MGMWVWTIYENFPICKEVGEKKAACKGLKGALK